MQAIAEDRVTQAGMRLTRLMIELYPALEPAEEPFVELSADSVPAALIN